MKTATSYADLIRNLQYASYRANRIAAPEITPEQWQKVYGETGAMERQYQAETTNAEGI